MFFCLSTEIIQGMVNHGMSVAAAGLACAFRLEDKFSPVSLLSSFVQEVHQTGKEMRSEGQASYVSQVCPIYCCYILCFGSLYPDNTLWMFCYRLKHVKNKWLL